MPIIKRLHDKHTHLYSPYVTTDQSQQYYNTKSWKTLRKEYLSLHPLCEECLKNNIIKPAVHIHHKREFLKGVTDEERWSLLLDPNNLQALCYECHKSKHKK